MASPGAEISGKNQEGLRQRMRAQETVTSHETSDNESQETKSPVDDKEKNTEMRYMKLETGSYWLARILLLRCICAVYFVAFLVALHQNRALIGKNGLLPADQHLNHIKAHSGGSLLQRFMHAPTLLWLFDYEKNIDVLLDGLAYAGLALSGLVVVTGSANIILMLTLWALYHSMVNVGQRWYSFGWESQVLETGFLGAFLCPLWSLRQVPTHTPTSMVVLWGFRWIIVRIMFGAGLIKIRGDKCWLDLTCMNYHYETQPVPNPISYYMHQEPEVFHKFETLVNHFVELVAPVLIVLPRRCRLAGGLIPILFMGTIIISGNLSFLNHLTMLPCLACFDDASISWMFSSAKGSAKHQVFIYQQLERDGKLEDQRWGSYVRRVFNLSLGLLLAYLSIPIVQNLVSTRQIMNTSFDPLRIVNTYGAFGSLIYLSIPVVENMWGAKARQKMNHFYSPFRILNTYGKFGSITKERTEVIFEGTYDNPNNPQAKWEEYEFKCKPGDPKRRPCLISPYHYRLDWLMWFAAFQNYQYNPWLVHLAVKFLENDELVTSLIAHNPFEGKDPPKFVRAEHYRYIFTQMDSKLAKEGYWWKRSHVGNYLPAVSLETLKPVMKQMGWKTRKQKKRK